jgi:hypothetical protein
MNAALVKVDVAADRLNWSAVEVLSLADEGTLLKPGFTWVWNLAQSLTGERRDLRFWAVEIRARALSGETFAEMELTQVISQILPLNRTNFHAGEVDVMFQIRPRTRIDLHAELAGSLKSGRNQYHRDDLAAFLKRRWIHAARQAAGGQLEKTICQ